MLNLNFILDILIYNDLRCVNSGGLYNVFKF